eukprot:517570-Prymnesium_polylepis.1
MSSYAPPPAAFAAHAPHPTVPPAVPYPLLALPAEQRPDAERARGAHRRTREDRPLNCCLADQSPTCLLYTSPSPRDAHES